jgi:hypothetical protein
MTQWGWLLVAACCLTLPVGVAAAQRDATSFGLYIENDAFNNSDTGYTNGIRLAWAINRARPGMRIITDYNIATAVNGLLGAHLFGVRALTLEALRLDRLGLLPKHINGACDSSGERGLRKVERKINPLNGSVATIGGACMILNLGIAQTMYTPDSLASTLVEPRDQPYAGFLFANIGVTTIDSPSATDSSHWLAYSEVSNQVIIGVTGQAAHAEDAQSIAHWTWSSGAHRPLGWRNQLRQSVQVGLISDLQFRPRKAEFCTKRCNGMDTEGRWLDFTPHVESVIGTHMVRFSEGLTGRIGRRFPDMIGMLRIPVSAPPVRLANKGCIVCEPFWWYAFGNLENRYVPYNMFIEGGLADGGPTGWRTIRQITARRTVQEMAAGLALGNTRFTARGQLAWRTPEYDVIGAARSKGLHGFGSLLIAVHPKRD